MDLRRLGRRTLDHFTQVFIEQLDRQWSSAIQVDVALRIGNGDSCITEKMIDFETHVTFNTFLLRYIANFYPKMELEVQCVVAKIHEPNTRLG
jgi:hypothetical protein